MQLQTSSTLQRLPTYLLTRITAAMLIVLLGYYLVVLTRVLCLHGLSQHRLVHFGHTMLQARQLRPFLTT
jgi:hypothetical protein